MLAHVSAKGELMNFVAVEVQSIDTTGDYRQERETLPQKDSYHGKIGRFQLGEVNKRILPQLIYKARLGEAAVPEGPLLRLPDPYGKISERLGGGLRPYSLQPGR